jgi:hypothetical protein
MMSLFAGGLDVDEPWQGRWEGGVLVECHGEQEREGQNHETKKRQKRETKRPWTTSSSSMPWTTTTQRSIDVTLIGIFSHIFAVIFFLKKKHF